MTRPGVEVSSAAAAPPLGVPTDTSVAFIVGEAYQGPVDRPTRITSMDMFESTYGGRAVGCESYDALDAYFHEGGATVYFMRLADGAVLAQASASAIVAGNTVEAASPGAWGDALKLDVVATPGATTLAADDDSESSGSSKSSKASKSAPKPQQRKDSPLTYAEATPQASSTFMATISQAGKMVAVSRPIVTRRELSEFVNNTNYVRLVGPDTDDPIAVGSVTLTAGDDGTMPVTDDTKLVDALALCDKTLGPGQVLAPGKTSFDAHAALLAHAADCNRFALLDADANADAATLASAAADLRGADQDRYGSLWAPWAVIPGIAPGTSRTAPWSAVEAALIARNDLVGNPNQAAAGSWGIAQYASDLSMVFTPDECEALLYAGVCTARTVYGTIEAYAFRTLVDPGGQRYPWVQANHARLNMAIVADSEAVGEDFVFSQIDGRGHTIAAFGGALTADLKGFYDDGALYGDEVTEAFVVNVGPAVNTPDSIADGVLRAVLSVRMSPHAELVQIQIVKYPVTVTLA